MANVENNEHIKGVFSTQEVKKIGTGTTTRRTIQKNFWFVETRPDGKLECQPLNSNYIPSGPKRVISTDELMEKFAPEPEFYVNSVFPKMMQLKNDLDSGDKHREKGETFTAECHYSSALLLDEENIRANFGIGLTYLQRNEEEKAQNILSRLVRLEAAFTPEHKHLFNDFGISLRKNKMFKEAIEYYARALELTKNDENLYLNVARLYLETKEYDKCMENLLEALTINRQHEIAQKLLHWMLEKNIVSETFETKARTFLPNANENTGEDTNEDSNATPQTEHSS